MQKMKSRAGVGPHGVRPYTWRIDTVKDDLSINASVVTKSAMSPLTQLFVLWRQQDAQSITTGRV
ncbi:MAG TPA: hypothetical protein VNM92_06565 [Thermoanaerobaculia bacterium]|nr:hypothetical protein [Thermoanaerobaculia bacterium]